MPVRRASLTLESNSIQFDLVNEFCIKSRLKIPRINEIVREKLVDPKKKTFERLKQSKKLRTPFWNWIELEIHCRQHCRVVLFTIQLVKYDANNPTMSSIKKREQEKKTSNKKKTNETKENRNNGRHFEFGRPFDEPMAGSPVVLVDNLPFFFKKKLFFFCFFLPFFLIRGESVGEIGNNI